MKKPEKKKWVEKGAPEDYLLKDFFHRVIADIFYNRGINNLKEAEDFLSPDFKKLPSPYLIPNIEKAAKRVLGAIHKKELICVYGDYDVDGITSTALIINILEQLKANYTYYIPSRLKEGYGLNKPAISKLAIAGVKLIITVDCGITALKEVELAREKGIDVIITDHHEVPEILPKAYAIVHPDSPGSKYPHKNLAGVGVAFKLAHVILNEAKYEKAEEYLKWLLDLVALGTIADIVPLVGENRILAHYGLIVLGKTKRIGLDSMYESAGIKKEDVTSYNVAFQIAPRLNAAGRITHAEEGLKILLSQDKKEASKLAAHLSSLNSKRQETTKRILDEALEMIDQLPDDQRFIILSSKEWSSGVIGIVASKIIESYSRPVILLQETDDLLHGSARSIEEMDLYQALKQCEQHLTNFGGHKGAAGLSLKKNKLKDLTLSLEEIGIKILDLESLLPSIDIETLVSFSEINDSLFETLRKLAPHGAGNPVPVFATKDILVISANAVGAEKKHLKLRLSDLDGYSFEAIGFGMGDLLLTPGSKVDLVYRLHENVWNGKKSLELIVLDLCIQD
ncbi:TPA: single-stranded-DNA-specific exonuclease RecJ [candidate division CPR2 bacterium]|uniref:Single-stranded-DNA-specific exonuclease RecJ n=1 Tax=candidate division CPR2 bacterium GW2011_GWC1_41_48 TaxID=1618344 RepID=A0A0G0W9L6_UNCC2|nr:MAG: Single-stranded-DNA-specific exonuclease RecJ [candidate division CPR2 bacterium GW2011_GWC2_39_35]KKR29490.1 MAG: Single-stranded-DNA-specific exonuclease RecJ [candidate division CPR2 bacterium GW2011_GWD2_39_7]KKR29715.1 MAG: Single-stranded-DNA-specific exonuclease RecJ [candidate division CPR2 bacterium GW2011_GWD1_39_7]KKS09645.1 MAG: single-stranded-DNA-specific exonuclease, single-stranded-DNA-specific exonuclease [candidate division CPR2 bacterium GW2011_GWC1_41_48]OGB59500.1 M